MKQRDECVYRNHYEIISKFASYCARTRTYLLIMEDDCKFMEKISVPTILIKNINILNRSFSFWHILHLGHLSTSPLLYITKELVSTTGALEAHCYLLNYRFLKVSSKFLAHYWKRPWMIESWHAFPKYTCFALSPSQVAIQSETPTLAKKCYFTYLRYLRASKFLRYFFYYILPTTTFGISHFLRENMLKHYIRNITMKHKIIIYLKSIHLRELEFKSVTSFAIKKVDYTRQYNL